MDDFYNDDVSWGLWVDEWDDARMRTEKYVHSLFLFHYC
jgi:hypothetical protein